jgi:thiol-disulfide isomerase/thioredoxin
MLLLILIGCEKKEEKPALIPIEDTTRIQKNTSSQPTPTASPKPTPSPQELNTSNTFILQGLEGTTYTIDTNNHQCNILQSSKDILIISFFTTWCPPCMTQLSYLEDLQKRYTKDILLTSILIHDPIKKPALKALLHQEQIFCFTSYHENNDIFAEQIAKSLKLPKNFSIPLTVLYVKGKYFTHYEGIIPIEMIEYDIRQAQNLLK